MPISVQDAFAAGPAPAAASGTAAPPPADTGPGVKVSDLFPPEKKKPSLIDRGEELAGKAMTYLAGGQNKVIAGQKAVGEGEKKMLGAAEHSQFVQPYLDDMNQWAKDYSNALHEDLKAYPEGTGNQVLQSLKTANDALAYATGPVMSPIYTGLIKPVQAGIDKLGQLVSDHAAAEDKYDAQARREGQQGQQYPKGIDWDIHKADVKRTVDGLQVATEALVNAGVGFIGGEHVGLPKGEVPVEKSLAVARNSIRDLKSASEPREIALKPTSEALDHSMGFEGIKENAKLSEIPVGSTRSTAALLDTMIPHAGGYAKNFLEKLNEHINPGISVRFKTNAGSDPSNLGVFFPETNQIELRAGHPEMIHTAVHEMVHAATINAMDTLIEADLKSKATELGRELTPREKLTVVHAPASPLLRSLDSVITEARIRAEKAGLGDRFYGLKKYETPPSGNLGDLSLLKMSPRYEFIAEIFSNPKLQQFLANSEKYASFGYKFKNIMSQLGELIGNHLGMKSPGELKLLNQSLKIGENLLSIQSKEHPPSERSIIQVVSKPASGEVITRGDVKSATVQLSKLADGAGTRRARESLAISVEQILRAISPESLGRNAKLAAAVVSSRIAEQMHATSIWRHGSDTRLKFWRGRPDMVNEFIEKFEKGQSFSDPVLQDLSRRYKEWNGKIFDQDTKISGLDYEPRDNYLYHSFEDSEGVANYFQRKYGSKWGDPKFIKDRSFDLYKEAVAAGFRPRFTNPEDIMLARQHASDIAAMHTGILADLEKYGLATRKVKGGEKLTKVVGPDSKVSFDIVKTEGNSQPADTARWRSPNGDVFWVDNRANVILENAFKSKSLWEDKGLGGTAFRGAMALKNAIIPIRLALSLFHPLHVAGIDMAAGWARTSAGILSGTIHPVAGLGHILRDSFGPVFENPKSGWRLMQVWKGKVPAAKLTAGDAEALRYIVEGGMIPEMSSQYRTNARANFSNALRDSMANFRQLKPVSAAGSLTRATWHLPWATISAMSAPIFEHWIPQLKTASYVKDVKNLLARSPELISNDAERQLALRKIAKSVDNRYGEMAYNTLFWKRWIKDVAVLDTLSLGWQLGFLREYGGGAMDAGQFATGGSKLARIRAGQLDRPLFVAAYTTLGAAAAGLMHYGMTGNYPDTILDFISPKTGEKNSDGSDQRVSTMFYSREFASLYKHIQNEGVVPGVSELVLNKGSGLFGLMHEWASGVNDFGQEIRDPSGDAFTKLEQTLAYTLTDLEPISMKAIQEQNSDDKTKSGVLSVLGFTPAPKYLTESKTTADIKTAFRNYVAPKMTPFDKAEYSKDFTALRASYQSGSEKFGDQMDKLVEQYELSASDQRRIMKSLNSDLSGETRMFMRLPWQEQKKILDSATVEEREELLPHANKLHLRNSYEPPVTK